MIGETAGGFRLVQKLGEGSMGEVFLGEHGGQKAAVKVLFPNFSKEGTALTRYFAEVRSTNLFGHPGIAQVYDCGVHTSGRAYLCMEYLPGKSLAAALGDMDNVGEIATLGNIGGQVAGALQAVHGKRMIHRALKADSIFVTSPVPYPVIKLLDFGVANFTQNVRHSQTGSLLGAPLYMSPEVGRGLGNVDHRADIYSLGCILFEMATGRPPFVREGAGQLIIAHATEAAPAARTFEPSIPPELDELIARCLRKDPAQRPQTMTEVAALLGRLSKPVAATPVPAQVNTPWLPPQVAAIPQASVLPAQAAVFPQAMVQAPSTASRAAATSTPAQRKPQPTALLAPSEPAARTPPAELPSRPQPVVRHQPTTLLDPPPRRVPIRESLPKRASRSAPTRVEPPNSRVLSLPVIALGGVIVLCVVAIVVLLLLRKPPLPKANRTPPASSGTSAPTHEEFQPPLALPPRPKAPAASEEKPLRPSAVRARPDRPAGKVQSHAQSPKSQPSVEKASEKAVPVRPRWAPRW